MLLLKKIQFSKKHYDNIKKEYENQFNDYRNEGEEGRENQIKEKIGKLHVHQLLKQIQLNYSKLDFDSLSLYPGAMSDEESICPRNETGCVYVKDMNIEFVEKFNSSNFTQGSDIFKLK